MRSSSAWVVAVCACAWATGCCDRVAEKAAEKAIEEATGGDASVAFGDNVDVSALPPAFRYPGATPKGRFSQNAPTGKSTVYVLESADDAAKVNTHYASVSGYKQLLKMNNNQSTIYNYEDASGKQSYHVTVAPSGPTTAITVVHTEQAP